MSRTYRRKNLPLPYWVAEELVRVENSYRFEWVWRSPNSKEYKKDVAKHYSDTGTHRFKEPGPGWFRNLWTERPQRRESKKILNQYIRNPDLEVMLLPKNPLEYWT